MALQSAPLPSSVALCWRSLHGAETLCSQGEGPHCRNISLASQLRTCRGGSATLLLRLSFSPVFPILSISDQLHLSGLSSQLLFNELQVGSRVGSKQMELPANLKPSWNSHIFFLISENHWPPLVIHIGILKVILDSSLSLTSPHLVNHTFYLLSIYLSLSLPFHFSLPWFKYFKMRTLTGMPFLFIFAW